ncbi:DUF1090 family protein [Flavobacterium sp. JP2137]|uniref:DUF1090 family protein n=1 Tax=Flavobacterium sp. JP2137 TaxID=3414510 RepID=UPI003D30116F
MTLRVRTTLILFFAFAVAGFAQNNCRDLKGCERKLCELQVKLEYAKKNGRTGQIRGLENAIYNLQQKCNSGTYKGHGAYAADLDKKIRDKEEKVKERTEELNEAVRENQKKEKIDKRRRKLEAAKAELEAAKKESITLS